MNKFKIGDIVNIVAQPHETHRDLNPWVVRQIRLDNGRMYYHIQSIGDYYVSCEVEEDLELSNGLETKPLRFLAAYRCSLYGDRYWQEETHQVPLRVIEGGHANIVRYTKDNMYTEQGRPVHMFVLNN